MDARLRDLLACPACQGRLSDHLSCPQCGASYPVSDTIPTLRLTADARTEVVRAFYARAPFPGYPAGATLDWLRRRARRSRYAGLLDEAIAPDARIVDVGCGTGQMGLFLARGERLVIGLDLTRESLLLGARAARRFDVGNVLFVETDLIRPGLKHGAFDVVHCSGVIHHTPDPREAFRQVAKLARPGGMLVIGVYNRFARIPVRIRRALLRWRKPSGDAALTERMDEDDRREAWYRDQYEHPEEHSHSLATVKTWFTENEITYLRSFPPSILRGREEPEVQSLFAPQADDWPLEAVLTQIGWMRTLAPEGGLFIMVGRRLG